MKRNRLVKPIQYGVRYLLFAGVVVTLATTAIIVPLIIRFL